MLGTLFGVGVGPGRADWLTMRAVEILRSVGVVAHPGTRHDGYALNIVSHLLDPQRQDIVGLELPMQGAEDSWKPHWQQSARRLAKYLATGDDVAVITEGDPMLYSTFGYVMQAVLKVLPTLQVEVVPGVSSMAGAAAQLQMPLVYGRDTLAVVPSGSREDIFQALTYHHTVVFLKVGRMITTLIAVLSDMQLLDRAVAISHVSSNRQEIVSDIRQLLEPDRIVPYMTIVIVSKDAKEC